ncbi:secreted ookinete protein, putative [Plasmodium vinckei vinckei]|uniref:Secreted ookinete protein, putative n=1 Tax=Plasmodium vinckei vinckei TaxID=54757 RepID=A0A449BYW1_PLAVN|nr:secreted ookinete protein, putative [Plasmodium vinckei vinckei]KEG04975.1 hypothetical protein YYE_00553 [Plasmodium vinckei vinckei]VEV58624.1 secreted ookinete protein, putative [Plasmodium vinckei vinckei]
MNIKNKLFIICIYFFILRNVYGVNLNDAENKFSVKIKNRNNETTERKQLIRSKNLSRKKRGQTNTSFIIKSTEDIQMNSKQDKNFNQSNFRNKPQTNDDVKDPLERDDTESSGSENLYDNNDDIDSNENSDYSSESTPDDLLNMDDLYSYADEDLTRDDITENESVDDLFEHSISLHNNLDKMDDKMDDEDIDSSLTDGAKKIDIDVVNAHENGAYLKESKQNSATKKGDDKTASDEKRDNRIISKPNKTIKKDTPETKVNSLNKLSNGSTHASENKKSNVPKSSGNKTKGKNNTNHKNKIDEQPNKGTDKIAKQNNANNIANKDISNKPNTPKGAKNSVPDIDDSNKTDKIVKEETKPVGETININIALNPEIGNENKKSLEKKKEKNHAGTRSINKKGKMSQKKNKSAKNGTKNGSKNGSTNNKLSANSFDNKVKTDKNHHKLENKPHAQKNGKHDKNEKHMASHLPDEGENDANKNNNDISISIEVPKEMGNIKIPSNIVKHIKKGNTMDIESFININSKNDNGNDQIGESSEEESDEEDEEDDEENKSDETKGGMNGPFGSNTMEVASLNTENKLVVEKEKEDKNLEKYSHENNAEGVENGEHPLITQKKNIIKNSRKIYNLKLYNCSYIDDWDLNNEYIDEEGKLVKLSGYVFQNIVNSDSMPTTNITDWKLKGSCDHDKYICGALKYMNNIYNKGERVIFDGKIYEATSDAYGNPKELANVWIDKTSDCYNF